MHCNRYVQGKPVLCVLFDDLLGVKALLDIEHFIFKSHADHSNIRTDILRFHPRSYPLVYLPSSVLMFHIPPHHTVC